MSDIASTATDIEERASLWLERRNFSYWSEQAQSELEAWLAESWENRVAFWRLDAAWNRTERLAALRRPDEAAPTARRPIMSIVMGIAAAFAIVAMLGVATAHFIARPADKTYATAIGGRETVKFADGTRIELNTNTVLRMRMTTAERTVWLEKGEAYFEVKHDAAHPFTVITGSNRVTDLGTKFAIRRDFGRLHVALLEGRVRFGAVTGHTQSVLLAPGDTVTATDDSISVTKEPMQALNDALSWRRGVLSFDNALLSDVVSEFNRYNSEKIVVADPAAASVTITGTFRTGNVEAFIGTVQRIFQLHIARHGDSIVISR